MKHIFIVNPAAGKYDRTPEIKEALRPFAAAYDLTLYRTHGPRDATRYIREYCTAHPESAVRFYACGGDGTLNEAAAGVLGFPRASLSAYPCGSGNDFIKYYGGQAVFSDMKALLNARETLIDVIRVGDRIGINACHFGFDTAVARTIERLRHNPVFGGSRAYAAGVAGALLTGMKHACTVSVDGERLNDAPILLCTLANGSHVGGSYRCAPRSDNADGLLEVCLVKTLSRRRFLSLMGEYKVGTHLESPHFKDIIVYRRGRKITVDGPEHFAVSVDGEVVNGCHFEVEALPKAIRFAVPSSATLHRPETETSPEKETEKSAILC